LCEGIEGQNLRMEFEDGLAVSDEASAPAFAVDLLEPLVILSLLDDAERREEETYHYCHEPVDSCEDVIQGCVRKCSDWPDASVIELVCCSLTRADAAPELEEI